MRRRREKESEQGQEQEQEQEGKGERIWKIIRIRQKKWSGKKQYYKKKM